MEISQSADPTLHCDVLIIGGGAGGLTAAVTAAKAGMTVIVAEKEPFFGGSVAMHLRGAWPKRPSRRGLLS